MSINRIRVIWQMIWGNRQRAVWENSWRGWRIRIHRQNPERERRIENLSRGCRIPESELPNWVRVHHECRFSALEREAARGRKVAIRQDWTLLELLGEPLLYNVNMNGAWGASLLDTAATFLAARDKNRSEA